MTSATDRRALLGDIGGTFSRLRINDGELKKLANEDYASFDALLEDFLAQRDPVDEAVFCVAGPVAENRVRLTNRGWNIDAAVLASRFGWRRAELINDFAAQALALPDLQADQIVTIQGGRPEPGACRAVLGPGTGLGVAALVPHGGHWVAVPGEGGHVSYPPRNALERELMDWLTDDTDDDHISAEDILSGSGIAQLYRFCGRDADSLPAAVAPAAVTAAAFAGEERAQQALQLFLAALGNVAGNLALTLGARGGVYLSGGILPRLYRSGGRSFLRDSAFLERFCDKGRYREWLRGIPITLVMAEEPAMIGLERALRQMAQSEPSGAGTSSSSRA